MPKLLIGTIEIPLESLGRFSQEYTERAGVDFRRTADGTGVVREAWSGKLATRITAEGFAPGLDFRADR